jgi:hypothetical protein
MNAFHRFALAVVTSVCVLAGMLALGDVSAFAAVQYPYIGEISLPEETHREYKLDPVELAFDGASGNIIVNGYAEIDAYGLSGELEWFLNHSNTPVLEGEGLNGVAVNNGTGDIYVDNVDQTDVFGSAGEYLFAIDGEGDGKPVPKGLVDARAVTVDQETGDVYVYDRRNEAIDVFTATGEYLFQITSAGGNSLGQGVEGELGGMAVDDATGELLIGDGQEKAKNSVVYVLDAATGAYITTWSGTGTPQKSFSGRLGLAVDNSTGDVYITASGSSEVPETPGLVDRFTEAGEYESQITGLPGSTFQPSSLLDVAISPASGDLYVFRIVNGNDGTINVFSGSPVAVPGVSVTPPTSLKSTSVTLHGLVNPEEAGEVSCEFEFGTSPSYGQRVPCSKLVANGPAAVPVEAQLAGLKTDTTYYYRLDAKDLADGDTNIGAGSEDLGQLTTPGPKLVSEGVSAVTAESASFQATVMPNGEASSAYFQYGTSEAYGTNVPVSPGIALGAGTDEVEFSRHVQELRASTVYHYRLVVLSEVQPGDIEEVDGPDHTFTTQPVAAGFTLADGRSWELVTPAEKHGALFYAQNYGMQTGALQPLPLVGQASVNGDAMIDLASAPTEAQPIGYGKEVSVLSTRGPDGWSSQVLALQRKRASGPALAIGAEYEFFSEDLSRGIVDPFGQFTPLSPEASESTPYLHTDYIDGNVDEGCESSCYRPLVTAANTENGVKFGGEPGVGNCRQICGPVLIGATPDASYVALESPTRLTSTPIEEQNLAFDYEWGGGSLQPLYLLPESEGGSGVGAGALSPDTHQLADNGSVFFAYKEHLYMHDFAKNESVRLDLAQGVAEPAAGGAKFLYAASDGSRVLFSDSKHLTSAGTGGIYECRIVEAGGVPGCELQLTDMEGGSFLGGSRDASYLYFEDGDGKLLVDHDSGSGWKATTGPLIGTLQKSEADLPQPDAKGLDTAPLTEVSPDGQWLTFMSEEELTGYDNRDAHSGRADVEVYLYEAESNKLVCASCNPTGARPVGTEYRSAQLVGGSLVEPRWVAANLPPWTKGPFGLSLYQPRFLSDSGRLFFDSHDALVPQDVDGTQDVYEYEPPGVGSCIPAAADFSERSGGCVGLISSGSSAEESAFMDASEGGGDVFFITLAKLTSQDFDNALDVYDAHECTVQVPCVTPAPVAPPPCSTGDSCKAAPTPQPSIFGAPSSATFTGAGNVTPASPPPAPKIKAKPLSRAQKLARALKACANKRRAQRAGCERAARKRYGKTANHGKKG